MDRAGRQFLAGARFTFDQYGHFVLRELGEQRHQLAERLRSTNHTSAVSPRTRAHCMNKVRSHNLDLHTFVGLPSRIDIARTILSPRGISDPTRLSICVSTRASAQSWSHSLAIEPRVSGCHLALRCFRSPAARLPPLPRRTM